MAVAIGNLEDMLFFPYNSVQTTLGDEDRLYDSQDWADYFRQFIGNGVFPNPSNGLKVESLYNSMVLTVRMGAAFGYGRLYLQKRDFEFSVTPAHLTLGRRDIVIVRHDNINRTSQVLYIEGTASSLPVPPSIIRTDDIFDLQLCMITVNPNAQSITQANILDTRLDPELCGIVHGVVDQVDTTAIFNQYQTALNEFLAMSEAEQEEWRTKAYTQTSQQQTDFDTQLAKQKSDWEEWFARINVDIQIIATFNFDNLAALPYVTRNTVFETDTEIQEEIRITGSNLLIAERHTNFVDDDNIETTEKVYQNGSLVRQSTIKITFNADGSITEVVS